jgi:hypothetical protein
VAYDWRTEMSEWKREGKFIYLLGKNGTNKYDAYVNYYEKEGSTNDSAEELAKQFCAAPLIPRCEDLFTGILNMLKLCGYGGSNIGAENKDIKRIDTLLTKLKAAREGK